MNRPLTGRGVALWLAGFFGVVIAANVWFVTLSLKSFHGEDRQRPYQQGLNYNRTLALRARQEAEGWQASLVLDTAAAPARGRRWRASNCRALCAIRPIPSATSPLR